VGLAQNTEEPGSVTFGSVPAGFTDQRLTSILRDADRPGPAKYSKVGPKT